MKKEFIVVVLVFLYSCNAGSNNSQNITPPNSSPMPSGTYVQAILITNSVPSSAAAYCVLNSGGTFNVTINSQGARCTNGSCFAGPVTNQANCLSINSTSIGYGFPGTITSAAEAWSSCSYNATNKTLNAIRTVIVNGLAGPNNNVPYQSSCTGTVSLTPVN